MLRCTKAWFEGGRDKLIEGRTGRPAPEQFSACWGGRASGLRDDETVSLSSGEFSTLEWENME